MFDRRENGQCSDGPTVTTTQLRLHEGHHALPCTAFMGGRCVDHSRMAERTAGLVSVPSPIHFFDLSRTSCFFSQSLSGNVRWARANANSSEFISIPNICQSSIRWPLPGFQHGSMQVPEEDALSVNILPLFFHNWVIHQIQPLEMEAGSPRSRFRDITQRSRQPQKRLFERDKNLSHSGNHFLGFGWDGRLRCRDPCE